MQATGRSANSARSRSMTSGCSTRRRCSCVSAVRSAKRESRRRVASPSLSAGAWARALAPALVIALGVSGEAPLDAVRGAGTIVTVHPDRDAPAHTRADFAILAEPDELIDALREHLEGQQS